MQRWNSHDNAGNPRILYCTSVSTDRVRNTFARAEKGRRVAGKPEDKMRSAVAICALGPTRTALLGQYWQWSDNPVRNMLEVIDKGCGSERHPAPLLFVHGAWHAAWCWEEHFLGFFADRGYRAVAVSLRGHGRSATSKPLRTCSFADYVEDISRCAGSLPRNPIIIGHSMGGLLVAKYLETHDAPAGILMAPTFPLGYLGTGLRWIRRHPWHFAKIAATGKSLAVVNTAELARERFFSAHTPESLVGDYAARLQEESGRIGIDSVVSFPRPKRVSAPVLVMGACDDRSVTRRAVRATARAYRTEAEFFPDMGHDMMLEPGWAAVAERIHTWLGANGL